MKVLICGDREWTDIYPIIREVRELPRDAVIIHGAARGADRLGGVAAEGLGHEVISVPAHWQHTSECSSGCREYVGRGAGPIRNRKMMSMGPDLVLAFHTDIDSSKGTKDMVTIAQKAGIETKVFNQ